MLTAAHCVDGAEQVDIVAGAHNIDNLEEPTQQFQIVFPHQITQHPDYDYNTNTADLALLHLTERFHEDRKLINNRSFEFY